MSTSDVQSLRHLRQRPRRPPVIAIGGMDRAGKSIQRRALMEHLRASGYDPVYRWSRVGYTRRIERAWPVAISIR